jgi:hypothetical protein
MQMQDAVELMNFLENQGFDAKLYEDYSGRGMYGNTTTGVTTDASPGEMEFMEEEMEEAEIDPAFRKDSMGLDYIYY